MNILLLSHSTGIIGPIDFLENYCLKGKNTVYKIQHPLDNYTNPQTIIFKNKKVISHRKRNQIGLITFIIDFVLSLEFVLKHKTDVVIGANNFDTLVAIIARKVFRTNIKKIIYFASDFSEKRFHNFLLDSFYLQIEEFVLKNADLTISNTKRAEKKRLKLGLDSKKSLVIPNGVEIKNPSFEKKEIDKRSFIFVGNVTNEHGLVPLLEEILPLIDYLVVIGQGEQWNELKKFIKNNHLKADLYFAKSHDFVIDYLQKFSGIGLAPYNTQSLWTYYCSPLKVNEYIASGIPVIISDVPEISQEIKEKKLGIMYKKKEFSILKNSIKKFNTENFSLKAKAFYKEYLYDNLYKKIPL